MGWAASLPRSCDTRQLPCHCLHTWLPNTQFHLVLGKFHPPNGMKDWLITPYWSGLGADAESGPVRPVVMGGMTRPGPAITRRPGQAR